MIYEDSIDKVARQVAADSPDIEEQQEMVMPLAKRVVKLLDDRDTWVVWAAGSIEQIARARPHLHALEAAAERLRLVNIQDHVVCIRTALSQATTDPVLPARAGELLDELIAILREVPK